MYNININLLMLDRCKHIKTVGKTETDLLRIEEEKQGDSLLLSAEGRSGQHTGEAGCHTKTANTLSPTCAEFLEVMMALLASIAARVASNGRRLCHQILFMMHDNLWLCWFPKDSLTNTAGWKRQGIFELQKSVFFGCKSCSPNGEYRCGKPDAGIYWSVVVLYFFCFFNNILIILCVVIVEGGGDDCSSDIICELFSTILINIAFQQV